MDKTPKTRDEKGKGKGAKYKDAFNQKTIRLKTAVMEAKKQSGKAKPNP